MKVEKGSDQYLDLQPHVEGTKFHWSARNYRTSEIQKGRVILPKHLSCRTSALRRITRSLITYYSLMFFIAYAFKGQVHGFAGRVKSVNHSSCRASTKLKYFCPLADSSAQNFKGGLCAYVISTNILCDGPFMFYPNRT